MLAAATVFLLCFAPRAAYLWWAPPGDAASSYYWLLSENLLRSGTLGLDGRPGTAFEPLYPMLLAAARWLTGDDLARVMLLQIAVASVGAVYLYRLCQWLADERTARICVLLYALYPYLVRQASSVIEITLLATLLIAAAFHFCRISGYRSAAAAGAAFGFTLLARAAVLPVLVLGLAFLVWRRRGAQALAVAFAACLMYAPMALRNISLDGSVLPTRSGDNLYAGNNRYADLLIPAYNTDLLGGHAEELLRRDAPQLVGAAEPEVDAFFRDKAVEWILQEPLRALRLKLWNVAYFFHPRIVPYYPSGESTELVFTANGDMRVEGVPPKGNWIPEAIHAALYSMILVCALAGAWLRRHRLQDDAILYFMLFAFAAVASLYFPATRLRAPVEFVLMFFAACAIARWTRRA